MMFMSIFWILILIGGAFFFRKWFTYKPEANSAHPLFCGSNSLDILKERYAKGEIDRKEYERMKHELTELG